MERTALTKDSIGEVVQKAAAVLRGGGVILYPTDTLYGLGVDSLDRRALGKLFAIKRRDKDKPVHSMVSDIDAAAPYAVVTPLAYKLADTFLPGPLTLLLQKGESVPAWAVSGRDMFGIRVSANAFCLALADLFGTPYSATSANKAGDTPQRSPEAILAQLGGAANHIDLIVDAGELPASPPSTVIDARGQRPIIVREGVIAMADILATKWVG